MRIRLVILLLIATGALIVYGGQGLYEALANRECKVLPYEKFVASKPSEGWFQIKNCYLEVPSAAWLKKHDKIEEAYIPVRASEGTEDETIHLLVATKDPQILATVEEVEQQDKNGSDASAKEWILNNIKRLIIEKDVKGMVRFGLHANSDTRDKIAKLDKNMAQDFVIIDEGAEPSLASSAGMLVAGLVLLALQVVFYLGRWRLNRA